MKMLYKRVRELREDSDLKQAEVAELLSMSQQSYSDLECGKVNLLADTLVLLARFYKVSADYILELSERRELL